MAATPVWPGHAAAATPPPAHPRLAALGDGEALDLGPYECESRAPGLRCETLFDYSRLLYDPVGQRMLAFGGGHAASGRTDIDAFDLRSLRWDSLYPSMSCKDVAAGDVDARGFHRATRHPVARHTYDQNVIARINGRSWLMMFSSEGFSGHCHPYKSEIRAVASWPLDGGAAGWRYGSPDGLPWGYGGAAEFDPVSGMVILLGGQTDGLWVYDPARERIVATLRGVRRPKNSSNLLYDPRGDRMLLVDRETMRIRAFKLDRANWPASVEAVVEATDGTRPPALRNLAYDTRHHMLGGLREGVFHAFDIASRRWLARPVSVLSARRAELGSTRHHAIDYDPLNNVFILVAGKPGRLSTWAYRWRQ